MAAADTKSKTKERYVLARRGVTKSDICVSIELSITNFLMYIIIGEILINSRRCIFFKCTSAYEIIHDDLNRRIRFELLMHLTQDTYY